MGKGRNLSGHAVLFFFLGVQLIYLALAIQSAGQHVTIYLAGDRSHLRGKRGGGGEGHVFFELFLRKIPCLSVGILGKLLLEIIATTTTITVWRLPHSMHGMALSELLGCMLA